MERPEDPPNKLNVLMALIEFQERRFQFDEDLVGLFLKSLSVLVGDTDIGWQFAVWVHLEPTGNVSKPMLRKLE